MNFDLSAHTHLLTVAGSRAYAIDALCVELVESVLSGEDK